MAWIFVIFLIGVSGIVVKSDFCTNGSLSTNSGYCYYASGGTAETYVEARSICRTMYGGDLPSIFTETESAFLKDYFKDLEEPVHEYWIGFTDLHTEDEFRDVMTNQPITYEKWEAGKPNGDTKDCVVLKESSVKWSDMECENFGSHQYGVVCQVQPDGLDPNTGCSPNMVPYTTSSTTECYWFSFKQMTATAACAKCASMAGELALINDQAMNDFLNSYLPTFEASKAWIGVQEIINAQGTSAYVAVEFDTTSPVQYTNFVETYDGPEPYVCVVMETAEGGEWTHMDCNETINYFICHFTNESTTYSEPPSTLSSTAQPNITSMASTENAALAVSSTTNMTTETHPTTQPSTTTTTTTATTLEQTTIGMTTSTETSSTAAASTDHADTGTTTDTSTMATTTVVSTQPPISTTAPEDPTTAPHDPTPTPREPTTAQQDPTTTQYPTTVSHDQTTTPELTTSSISGGASSDDVTMTLGKATTASTTTASTPAAVVTSKGTGVGYTFIAGCDCRLRTKHLLNRPQHAPMQISWTSTKMTSRVLLIIFSVSMQ